MKRFFLGVILAMSCVSPALADDFDPANGWGTSFMRFTGTYLHGNTERPLSPAAGGAVRPAGSPNTTKGSYNNVELAFDLYGFFDQTIFGTFLGGEMSTALGSHGQTSFDTPVATDPAKSKGGTWFKFDFAFDFDVLHFKKGPVAARLVGGLGTGFEYDARRWYLADRNESWRGYTIALARLQVWVREIGFHGSIHYLPNISGAYKQRESRTELCATFGSFAAGVRLNRLSIWTPGVAVPAVGVPAVPGSLVAAKDDKFSQTEFGVFGAYGF